MLICTKCGHEANQGEEFCGQCGAFLEWTGAPADGEEPRPVTPAASPPRHAAGQPEQGGPPVVATLSASRVRVEPGGEASVNVEVRNRGRTVDQLTLEITGPAAAWASAEPPRLNIMPGTSAVATITFRPARTPSARAGDNPADIAVRSSQHPDDSLAERVVVDVAPFVALEATLAPSVLRGAAATATLLHVTNGGNVPIELALSGDDPELAFSFGINPPKLSVDPGTTTDALVVVKPRAPLQAGPDRTRPFRVVVTTSDGSRRGLDGTFVQAPVPAPPPPEPTLTGPPLVATVSASDVRVYPGGEARLGVEIRNRDRRPDQVALVVRGPAAAWASADPTRLSLGPEASATITLVIQPPRTPSPEPGRYPMELAVRSAEHVTSIVERVNVDVLPFVALETSMAPSVLRGGREATAKLRVANRGNATVDLVLGGDDPEMAFDIRVSPSKLRLKAGEAGTATTTLKARRENRTRADLTRPFRIVLTAGDGSRHASDGTFVQEAPPGRRRWPWALALLGLLGVVAVVVASIYPPGPQPPPPSTAPATASVPVGPSPPSTAPATASVPVGPDIGGLYYLDPGNNRIIVVTPIGENRYTIEEQLPASWPFKGTLEWIGGSRYEGPATFASGTEFRVEVEQRPDGWLATRFVYISDDQGNPTDRKESHELVPVN